MDTDLTHAWMIGYQRHPTLRGVWKMVDMDLDVQRKVRKE
jgi:hypothetical protein